MLLEKTWNYICTHKLILPGETVLAGVSGGADSICLLVLLKELGERHGFSVHAVHVNHKLRGEESEWDQAFVEEFCRVREIPLHCFSYPVEEMARKMQTGIEDAGREARRQAFALCRKKLGAQKTALAHHRRDQAETVLFRLARGSSLGGLAGIRPLQDGVIHPLLFAEKEEILLELEQRGLTYRTDSSNLTEHYTRNCIRRRVLPVLEEKVNERCVFHMAEAAEDLAETEDFLKRMAAPVRDRCLLQKGQEVLIRTELLEEEAVLRRYVLMDALELASGGRKNLGREQIRQLQDLLEGGTGRRNDLPGRLEAVRTYEGVLLRQRRKKTADRKEEISWKFPVPEPGKYGSCRVGKWRVTYRLLSGVPGEIPEKTYTKWLDYDKIKDNLEFRTRRSGDYLVTGEAGGRKKLKAYFIDEKIPAEKRETVLLLASGSRIFWVAGYRISQDCKITEQTEKVLEITVSEDDKS